MPQRRVPCPFPKCSGRLEEFELEGIKLDFCSTCMRTWFDRGELSDFLGVDGFEFDLRAARFADDPTLCPKCQTQLLDNLQPDVGALACRQCGGVMMTRVAFCFLRAHLRLASR